MPVRPVRFGDDVAFRVHPDEGEADSPIERLAGARKRKATPLFLMISFQRTDAGDRVLHVVVAELLRSAH